MAIPDSVESGSCTCELFDGTDFRPIPESPSVHRPIADPIVTTIPPGRPNLSPLRSSPLLLARLSPSSSQAQQQQWMECGPDKETPRVGVTRRCCRAFFQITLFNSGDPRRNRNNAPWVFSRSASRCAKAMVREGLRRREPQPLAVKGAKRNTRGQRVHSSAPTCQN